MTPEHTDRALARLWVAVHDIEKAVKGLELALATLRAEIVATKPETKP